MVEVLQLSSVITWLPRAAQISAGKGMSAQAQPILAWFSSSFEHKWGALKSAYAAVIGKV